MNYKLLFIIIVVLSIGAISGYFVLKSSDIQIVEKINTDLTKSRKITNASLEDFYKLKDNRDSVPKLDKDPLTIFYFYSDCPHFTEDVLIRDIKKNYYYLPEKNSVIVIRGEYEWTKEPKDILFYVV